MPRTGAESRSQRPAPCLASQPRKVLLVQGLDARGEVARSAQHVGHQSLDEDSAQAGHDGQARDGPDGVETRAPVAGRRALSAERAPLEQAAQSLPEQGGDRRGARAGKRAAHRQAHAPWRPPRARRVQARSRPGRSPTEAGRRRPVRRRPSAPPVRRSPAASAGRPGDSSRARDEARAPRSCGRAPDRDRWPPCRPGAIPGNRGSRHTGREAGRRSARRPPRRRRTRPRRWRSVLAPRLTARAAPEAVRGAIRSVRQAPRPRARPRARAPLCRGTPGCAGRGAAGRGRPGSATRG